MEDIAVFGGKAFSTVTIYRVKCHTVRIFSTVIIYRVKCHTVRIF